MAAFVLALQAGCTPQADACFAWIERRTSCLQTAQENGVDVTEVVFVNGGCEDIRALEKQGGRVGSGTDYTCCSDAYESVDCSTQAGLDAVMATEGQCPGCGPSER